jgi:hypothetical protein
MIYLLFWPIFLALFAAGQGLLMAAIRRTPPGSEASQQAFALHWLFTAVYFLPFFLCPPAVPFWLWAVVGFGVRVIAFDVVLNYASGYPLFAVGSTAATDLLIRKLAPINPARLNAILKATAFALLAAAAIGVAIAHN